jgi:hypothetical protein
MRNHRFGTCVRTVAASVMLTATVTVAGTFVASAQTTAGRPEVTSPLGVQDGSGAQAGQTGGGAPASVDPGFLGSTELGGVADVYYVYNSNNTPGDATFRNFDTRHSELRVSMIQMSLTNTPTTDHRFGFALRLIGGHAATLINAAEPSTADVLRYIEQAYVTYLVPAGKGLQIDFGKFVTQHGAEVIEAKDNWNYSRSLLFVLAAPGYHMGVRGTYVVSDKVALMAAVVNGWNDVKDNNGRKTFGVQATVRPIPQLSIVQNYMAGPEQPHNTTDWRTLSDTIITIAATPALSLMANVDYGTDRWLGSDVRWDGVAAYARWRVNDRLAIAPRLEWFEDPQGFMTGTAQTLKEATLTGELKLGKGFICRVEFRHDRSDVASFKTDTDTAADHQSSLGVGVLYSFTRKR